MFTKKSLPITAALILVIALASLGVAYGLWTDTLHIGGNVSLGTLDVNFVSGGAVPEVDPYNIGTCTVTYGDDVATITITGAYPGYQCTPTLTVKNDGSIAVTGLLDLMQEPVAGLYIGGVTLPLSLIPGAQVGFTVPIDVYDPPSGAMGQTYSFSYDLTFTQAP
jgi:hypothetical protein